MPPGWSLPHDANGRVRRLGEGPRSSSDLSPRRPLRTAGLHPSPTPSASTSSRRSMRARSARRQSRSSFSIAGRLGRLHRDGGRRRGYPDENARRRLAGDRLKISPARDVSGQRVLSEETCKKCPFYVGSREVSGSRSVARFARLEQAANRSGSRPRPDDLCAISGWCSSSLARHMGASCRVGCRPRP